MAEPNSLIDHVLDQAVEQTRDHRQMLMDIATRIKPYTPEVIDAWTQVYREVRVREPLPPDEVIREIQSAAVALFFGGLSSGDLREYFSNFAVWGRQLALSGLSYDRLLKLLREYQRSSLPLVMRAYLPGPELELAFNALDHLNSAMAPVIAAAYIQAAQEQLINGARSRALSQLTLGASQALSDILATIVGRAQLLTERARDVELRDEMREIQRAAAIGAEMVRHLHEATRVGREQVAVDTDVNVLLRQAADTTRFAWREQAENAGIVIDVVKDFADVPPVKARPSELRSVFIELLLNAIEAMPKGGSITLRTERKENQVLVSVIDTGEGMNQATRLRVFEPFFTTKDASHPGLGLSTAATIIKSHDGQLTVESEPGRGSTFTIALSVAEGASDQTLQTPTPSENAVTVLIIDDEPMMRDLIKKFLIFRGHRVTVADNGKDGLDEFRRSAFDLVMTDLGMPGMSGWQVASQIKKLHPKTLVVLMSGWSVELDPKKVKASGVDRVVHKPFDMNEVLALVDQAVTLKGKI